MTVRAIAAQQEAREAGRRRNATHLYKGFIMRTFQRSFGLICCGSIAALMAATPALADEADAPPAITINGTATVVSDYRFRGLSQTDKDFALQGSITVSHESGLYASVWGSTIDDYVAAGGDQELDLIIGFKKTFGGTTVDVGALYYYYPGSRDFIPTYNSDFIEPYIAVSHALGPVTAKVTANYAPKQEALDYGFGSEDSLYGALDLSAGIPNTPLSVSAHAGHYFTKSFLSAGDTYTDWNVGVSATFKALTIGVVYVDTNLPDNFAVNPISGKDIGKGGVFGTIGVSF
jgi:uncharacterized protein (TIGR02001 family)